VPPANTTKIAHESLIKPTVDDPPAIGMVPLVDRPMYQTTPSVDAVFSFEGVSVRADETAILRDIDLRVPSDGITVVTGRSGSGKSTLTRLCNRLIDASAGTVRLRGVDVRELDVLELRRGVGMVFQRPTLFAGTVADNLTATGVEDGGAFAEGLKVVGLDASLLEQTASTLSGGESQRVCLARALLMRPNVLVADEPTSSLDETSTRMLEALARDLASSGVPVLWVTHDLAQAERIADHSVAMEAGRVTTSEPGMRAA
jgi:putative ABC transport system ATP-binding protein